MRLVLHSKCEKFEVDNLTRCSRDSLLSRSDSDNVEIYSWVGPVFGTELTKLHFVVSKEVDGMQYL